MLEQILERIAIALERLAGAAENIPAPEKVKPGRPAKVAAAPVVEEDPLAETPSAFTQDQVRDALRAFMKVQGKEPTMAVMIKYGADKVKPLLPQIKAENYAALMKEIEG